MTKLEIIERLTGIVKIEIGNGAHYAPRWNDEWDDKKKIAYSLAIAQLEYGVEMVAYDTQASSNGKLKVPAEYGVCIGPNSIGCGSLESTLRSITDFAIGYSAAIDDIRTQATGENK